MAYDGKVLRQATLRFDAVSYTHLYPTMPLSGSPTQSS